MLLLNLWGCGVDSLIGISEKITSRIFEHFGWIGNKKQPSDHWFYQHSFVAHLVNYLL